MKASQVLALAAVATPIIAGDAPEVSDSPQGAVYEAVFHKKNTTDIHGKVQFSVAANGTALVTVDLEGLPEASKGPFPYHIHEKPVPSDGNCTGTGAHLNPYGGVPASKTPQGKEVGDLAGRHGNLTTGDNHLEYADSYISLNPEDKAYFGGLSVVVHDRDNKRLTCANITLVEAGESTSNLTEEHSSASSSAKPSEVITANGANVGAVGVGAAVAAAVAYLI